MAKTNFEVNKANLEITMSRVFAAPRELVWKTMTDPKLILEWWGPRQFTTVVDKMDFRIGGEWRFVQKDDKGNEFGFHGVYQEIASAERLSDTFNYEGIPPGHELVETAVLTDTPEGGTNMTTISKFANAEDLEGMLGSGMEGGATESWERFAELVEKA